MKQQSQSERDTLASLPSPPGMHAPLAEPVLGRPTLPASSEDKMSASGESPISAAHVKFADEAHSYVREYIRNADHKATFFFATLTAILAFLNAQNVSTRWLKDIRLWSFIDALGFISMLGLSLGAVILLGVVFPRLKGSRRGILFFDAISGFDSAGEYAVNVAAHPADELVRGKLQHCYELSKICSAKYRMLRVGFWVGCVGVGSALLYLVLARSVP